MPSPDELSRALADATATARAQLNGPDPETVALLLEVADRLESTTQALADRVREIREEHLAGGI
jgi:hypothetical protein